MVDLFPHGTIVARNLCNFKLVIVIGCCLLYRVGAHIYPRQRRVAVLS